MKKRFSLMVLLALSIFLFVGCEGENITTDTEQAKRTEMIQDRLNAELGLPNISDGQEKRLVKELYELRDQANLLTYTYTYSEMSGKFHFLGKSFGFGIPASVQYSNPEKIVVNRPNRYGTLPQAEPNGLFMPEGLSATWVYLIDPVSQQARASYVEPLITVMLFPLPYAVYPEGGPQYADLIAPVDTQASSEGQNT